MKKEELILETYKGRYYIAKVTYECAKFLWWVGKWKEVERKYLDPVFIYENYNDYKWVDNKQENINSQLILRDTTDISIGFVSASNASSWEVVKSVFFTTKEDAVSTIAVIENLVGYEIPEILGKYQMK